MFAVKRPSTVTPLDTKALADTLTEFANLLEGLPGSMEKSDLLIVPKTERKTSVVYVTPNRLPTNEAVRAIFSYISAVPREPLILIETWRINPSHFHNILGLRSQNNSVTDGGTRLEWCSFQGRSGRDEDVPASRSVIKIPLSFHQVEGHLETKCELLKHILHPEFLVPDSSEERHGIPAYRHPPGKTKIFALPPKQLSLNV